MTRSRRFSRRARSPSKTSRCPQRRTSGGVTYFLDQRKHPHRRPSGVLGVGLGAGVGVGVGDLKFSAYEPHTQGYQPLAFLNNESIPTKYLQVSGVGVGVGVRV